MPYRRKRQGPAVLITDCEPPQMIRLVVRSVRAKRIGLLLLIGALGLGWQLLSTLTDDVAVADVLPLGIRVSGTNAGVVLSADGRHVVFSTCVDVRADRPANTQCSNPENWPAEERQQIFERDVDTGVTHLVSVNRDGTAGVVGTSYRPTVSGDGRYVAFFSCATALVAEPSGGDCSLLNPSPTYLPAYFATRVRLYVRDVLAGSTRLIPGLPQAPGGFDQAVISADGGKIAYSDTSAPTALHVLDLNSGADTPVVASTFDYAPRTLAITPDGTKVAAMTGDGMRLYDVASGTSVAMGKWGPNSPGFGFVPVDDFAVALSSDGRYASLTGNGFDSSWPLCRQQTLNCLWAIRDDLANGTAQLASLSRDPGGGPDNYATAAGISASGRYVLFSSCAQDVLTVDPPADPGPIGCVDPPGAPTFSVVRFFAYLRDMESDRTIRIGPGIGGAAGMSADARTVLFSGEQGLSLWRADGSSPVPAKPPVADPVPQAQPSARISVVLVGGLGENTSEIRPGQRCRDLYAVMCDSLTRAGYPVYVVSASETGRGTTINNRGAVHSNGQALATYLREIVKRPALLVGHSMGGLFARDAISRGRVAAAGLFTIGTPFDGSYGADIVESTGGMNCATIPISAKDFECNVIKASALGLERYFGTDAMRDLTHDARSADRLSPPAVPTWTFAGTAVPSLGMGSEYYSPNDVIVGRSSAFGAGADLGPTTRQEAPVWHLSKLNGVQGFGDELTSPAVYARVLGAANSLQFATRLSPRAYPRSSAAYAANSAPRGFRLLVTLRAAPKAARPRPGLRLPTSALVSSSAGFVVRCKRGVVRALRVFDAFYALDLAGTQCEQPTMTAKSAGQLITLQASKAVRATISGRSAQSFTVTVSASGMRPQSARIINGHATLRAIRHTRGTLAIVVHHALGRRASLVVERAGRTYSAPMPLLPSPDE